MDAYGEGKTVQIATSLVHQILLLKSYMILISTKLSQLYCSSDAATFHKFVEENQVFEPLARLNQEFEQVQSQIPGRDTPLLLAKVYSHPHREKRRMSAKSNLLP